MGNAVSRPLIEREGIKQNRSLRIRRLCLTLQTCNILDKFPKYLQAKAKEDLHAIWMADTKEKAHKAFERFIKEYSAKYPKATECLEKDQETLLTFYDFPAEHWVHLRTTNPIESTFATVKHRTIKSKGCFSRTTLLTMVFKLCQSAQKNWKRIRGFERLAEVITGVQFINGMRQDNGSVIVDEQYAA